MWAVATLRREQYREFRLSAINDSEESIKNKKYILKFKPELKKPSDTE
jgi:hypothetical protein